MKGRTVVLPEKTTLSPAMAALVETIKKVETIERQNARKMRITRKLLCGIKLSYIFK